MLLLAAVSSYLVHIHHPAPYPAPHQAAALPATNPDSSVREEVVMVEEEKDKRVEDMEEQEVTVIHQTADREETKPEVGVTTRSLMWCNDGSGGGLTFQWG